MAQRLDGTGNQTVHGRRQAAFFWLFATCTLPTVPRIGWSCSQQANVRHSAGFAQKDQANLKNEELHRGHMAPFFGNFDFRLTGPGFREFEPASGGRFGPADGIRFISLSEYEGEYECKESF